MTSAPGTKKKIAAMAQRLIEEVPLWPAAAIQRGPRTVAMLNSSTSQKPMVLRSWDLGSGIMRKEDHTAGASRSPVANDAPLTASPLTAPNSFLAVSAPQGDGPPVATHVYHSIEA